MFVLAKCYKDYSMLIGFRKESDQFLIYEKCNYYI